MGFGRMSSVTSVTAQASLILRVNALNHDLNEQRRAVHGGHLYSARRHGHSQRAYKLVHKFPPIFNYQTQHNTTLKQKTKKQILILSCPSSKHSVFVVPHAIIAQEHARRHLASTTISSLDLEVSFITRSVLTSLLVTRFVHILSTLEIHILTEYPPSRRL